MPKNTFESGCSLTERLVRRPKLLAIVRSGSEAQLGLGEYQITDGLTQLQAGQAQLDAARKQYESAREEALKNANLDQLLNITTLSQLIMAQNFSMPAGYIDDADGNSYRLGHGLSW